QKYPEYTTKSALKHSENKQLAPAVFSIGYEKKDIDLFLDYLIQNRIDILVDVRANPFSMNFAFTKKKLEQSLNSVQIEYTHFPELGIDGELRKKLETDADYKRLFDFYEKSILPNKTDKLKALLEIGKRKRIALMCFEADHEHCHRGIISKKLEEIGDIKVAHL
ncbi:MAG: DUF488 domain-containing protein, partial [Candidatus Micrarchaeota archaeon]